MLPAGGGVSIQEREPQDLPRKGLSAREVELADAQYRRAGRFRTADFYRVKVALYP